MKRMIFASAVLLVLSGVAVQYAKSGETSPRARDFRSGFECGAQWEDGLTRHCTREFFERVDFPYETFSPEYFEGSIEACVEALYGSGDDELNAVRETYGDKTCDSDPKL